MAITLQKSGDSHMVSNLGSQVTILKEEKYFSGHKEADDYYRFGFNWVAGSK
jgi:tellurite resistance protein TerA